MALQKLTLLPTNYCNFRCEHCGILKSNNEDYISLSMVENLLKHGEIQGFKSFGITGGGEPSLEYEKLLKIIKIAKEKNFLEIGLVTNGSFLLKGKEEKRLQELRNVGLKKICFSFDRFHSKFIAPEFILNAAILSLKHNLKVELRVTCSEIDHKDGLKFLRRVINNSNFNLKLKLLKKTKFIKLGKLLTKNGEIDVTLQYVFKTEANNIIVLKQKLEDVVFANCSNRAPVVKSDGTILPCCTFQADNHPELYSLGNVKELGGNRKIDEYLPFLKRILYDRFPFLNLYLKARKDKELKKILESREYQDHCDLCYIFMKNKEKIEKLPEVSKTEIILFSIRNFHYLLKNLFERLKSRISFYKRERFRDLFGL